MNMMKLVMLVYQVLHIIFCFKNDALSTYSEKSNVQPSTSTADFNQCAIDVELKNYPIQFVKMSFITPEQKNYILELDPCQPLPEDIPGKMYPKDKYGRHFNYLCINIHGMAKDGFSTWINGLARIINHEVSTYHITSTIKVKTRIKCLPLLPSMEHKHKYQISINRQIVSKLITIVIFLAQYNLGFRDHNEK
ncbi:uncharacterized protein LOC112683860 isoform X3 [Sipha flava]|uniref:Uncharacterized protein LOC112683860 isoform X3 n=1 Tax=Sipha flava TaxID=143950 RepID=A0A8B8FJQ1_9HEMI|nr:uncharacterized protein LOC112683860 isoform X3 [Sipha flava]